MTHTVKTKDGLKRVSIDPITRLEGHGKIEIFLNEEGNVANAYFQVPELRGFEKFCEDRPVEELPRITPRICGVCPGAHHMASAKAVDGVFGVSPTPAAKKLRELYYVNHMIHSHIAHFYALAAPDFVIGPDAPKAERNILGVVAKVGVEAGTEVIKHRAYAQKVQEIIGGKATHSVAALPGGMSKALSETDREVIEEMMLSQIEFAAFSLKLFKDAVLSNENYVELITGDTYAHNTHYMALVDENNKVNFYEGMIRVVDTKGEELYRFKPEEYLEYIGEHVESWSYLKFPYLKKKGWHGLVDGQDSGIYAVGPLARLNVADGMATPKAQEAYEEMFETLGGKPVHGRLANHWARLVEMMYAAELGLELIRDPEITSTEIRQKLTNVPSEGFGVVEAPRGILFHHYQTDERGMAKKVNIIVATTHNNAPICLSIKKAAQGVIKNGEVNDGLLNMVEMAFRAYDPCLGCATHSMPGEMPLEVTIKDTQGRVLDSIRRH